MDWTTANERDKGEGESEKEEPGATSEQKADLSFLPEG